MRPIDAIARPTAIKRVFLSMASLVVISGAALSAQTITGTWQGTLLTAESPHIVIKIAKADDGSLRGSCYRIDRGPGGTPLSSITFLSPDLSVALPYGDVSYQGKLSANGRSIEGIWTEDKKSYPLTFALATPDTLWKHPGPIPLPPMSATADPAFEVATIKPSQPDAKGNPYQLRTRHFAATNRTVEDLITFAYKVRTRQISGGPSWVDESKFDIAAEPDAEGMPSEDQYRLMVRKLLADRFHLAVHSVQTVFPVYALTVERVLPN
jgi:hypothetical protein